MTTIDKAQVNLLIERSLWKRYKALLPHWRRGLTASSRVEQFIRDDLKKLEEELQQPIGH